METIQFDSGVREYRINGTGILRFHPGDPNVYARFLEAGDRISKIGRELTVPKEDGKDMVSLMAQADRQVKEVLNWVFGCGNDFDQILGGVNLLAVAQNGQQVITNLLEALEPVLTQGAETCAKEQADLAAKQAEMRRENR